MLQYFLWTSLFLCIAGCTLKFYSLAFAAMFWCVQIVLLQIFQCHSYPTFDFFWCSRITVAFFFTNESQARKWNNNLTMQNTKALSVIYNSGTTFSVS